MSFELPEGGGRMARILGAKISKVRIADKRSETVMVAARRSSSQWHARTGRSVMYSRVVCAPASNRAGT